MLTSNCVLVLAPHTDDGELGCGGTLDVLVRNGSTVYYVAFSSCRSMVPKEFPEDILEKELISATSRLGLAPANVFIENYEVMRFSYSRQEILDTMIRYRARFAPQLVFVPSESDVHQDHHVIRQEAVRAFKNSTILGYELPWNMFKTELQMYIRLTNENVESKVQALSQYRSQASRIYFKEEFTRSLACVRGVQAGVDYAEAFEVVRMIYKNQD